MDPTIAIIIFIPLAALIIAGAIYAARRWRTEELRNRFGPEYDRALHGHGSRRSAEHHLAAREKQALGLQLRSLSDPERLGFADNWAALQRRFVDNPVGAVRDAHRLLEDLMGRRGYPTHSFQEEVELLSVHHPRSVQHYRAAHELHRQRGGEMDTGAGTENYRQAMIHYRALFEDLLEVPGRRQGVVEPRMDERGQRREARDDERRAAAIRR